MERSNRDGLDCFFYCSFTEILHSFCKDFLGREIEEREGYWRKNYNNIIIMGDAFVLLGGWVVVYIYIYIHFNSIDRY